jgi:hypothetical protein
MTKALDIKGASTLKKMKNAVQATVGNNTEDRLIGSVAVQLEDSSETSSWMELQKKDKPKKRGEVQLTYTKCACTKKTKTAILEYQKLTNHLICQELNGRYLQDFVFAGDFCENAREILRLYAQNGGLTVPDVALCQWSAAADVHQNHRLSFAWFQQLLDIIEPELAHTQAANLAKFWSASVKIMSSIFCTIRQTRKFHHDKKSDLEGLTEVLNLLAGLANLEPPSDFVLFPPDLYSFWIKTDVPLTFELLLGNSIEIGAKKHFEEITNEVELNGTADEKMILKFVSIIQLLQADLQKAEGHCNGTFKK